MSPPRPTTVVIGEVLVTAEHEGLERAEAIGLADGRVVSVGTRSVVLDTAAPGARVLDVGPHAVVPGLHDFHLHLVGMAHARLSVNLDHAGSLDEAIAAVAEAAARLPPDAWLGGRGWREPVLAGGDLERLDAVTQGRPALIYSHDGHSAWASATALRMAGIDRDTADPAGGRIERHATGHPTGILRERATDVVDRVAVRAHGSEVDRALDDTVADLAALGVTGAVDAGDSSADNGVGDFAALGDSASSLASARGRLDGQLRLTINVPAEAIRNAAELGFRTGQLLPDASTIRAGWAKAFVDGALGSRTAALFEPYSCGKAGDTGIPRLTPEELDALLANGRTAGIGLAIHAIGDRGASMVLEAFERAPGRSSAAPPDRMEHLQLLRPDDARRLARADVTASIQPIHCASDRGMVEECWAGRQDRAYPWRTLAGSGARLAFGSDAPIESPNPWLGVFAAVHRRFPDGEPPDWHPEQALRVEEGLAGYTSGPAAAGRHREEGHLRPGAHADLAVLNVDLATLRRADEALAGVRSELTMVAGSEVWRS